MLVAVPVTVNEARAFVRRYHRHSLPPSGGRFAVGVSDGEKLVGVAIAGRPVARLVDDGLTLEITRVCTDGTRNACSFLYGRVVQIARLMGYKRVITYTLTKESGASLRAVGAKVSRVVRHTGGWNRRGREREERPIYYEEKLRWELM